MCASLGPAGILDSVGFVSCQLAIRGRRRCSHLPSTEFAPSRSSQKSQTPSFFLQPLAWSFFPDNLCTFLLVLRFLVFCYVSKNTDAHRSRKLSSRRLLSLRRHSESAGGGLHPSAAQRDALWPLRWHRRRNPER